MDQHCKPTNLGSSLKVPNVQELAKETLQSVPSRYVRVLDDHDSFSSSSSLPEIPVIDFHKLFDKELMDSEHHKLHCACQDWGFFQLINHGVDTKVIEAMKLEIQRFFNLPIEEKKRFDQNPGDIEGYGQAFVLSEDQKLDWADVFYVLTLPAQLRKSHLIPSLPPPFRDVIELYSAQLKTLGTEILEQIAEALKMKHEDVTNLFDEEASQSIRMNYYPACPQPELVTGLGPHSDPGGLTILLQVNEVEGLQIKKDGIWIPVSAVPDAFVINIGDMLEVWTNGNYRSVEHQAIVNSEKARLSIATFLAPRLDGELGPAPSLVGPESQAKFKTVGVAEYLRGVFSRELIGKSYLYSTLRI